MNEKKIFGIKSLVVVLLVCCIILIVPRILEPFNKLQDRALWLSVIMFTVSFLQSKFIVVKNDLVRFYSIFGLLRKEYRWVFISNIQRMHITKYGKTSYWSIHLQLKNDTTTSVAMPFLRMEIKAFERFMMKNGIDVQDPD